MALEESSEELNGKTSLMAEANTLPVFRTLSVVLQGLFMCMILYLPGTYQALAGVYKWTDEDGRVHYSDKPGDNAAEEIEIEEQHTPGKNKKSLDRKVKQERLLQLFAEEREEKKKQQIDEINEKIARKNTCNKARNYRQEILASGYLYEEDEKGNKRILSTEEFEEHLGKTEKLIQENCT